MTAKPKDKVGASMSFVDAMPRDNATMFGTLQAKIFHMLDNERLLTPRQSDFLQSVYCQYQQGKKMSKRQIMWILGIWKDSFTDGEGYDRSLVAIMQGKTANPKGKE